VVRNPKIAATDADLREQFALASQISEKVGTANGAVVRIRDIKAQIAERAGRTNDAKIAAAADVLTTVLTNVEGEIYQYRNRSSQDPLNFPIKLNNKLAALQSIVEYGDYKPTDQSYAVFRELSAELDKQLAMLEELLKSDLVSFNQLLAKRKITPVAGGGE
jgi:hypothetical protein